jgi:hypothetical protein
MGAIPAAVLAVAQAAAVIAPIVAKALAETRDFTPQELADIQKANDAVYDTVLAKLLAAAKEAA